jgi:hypothetical protein
MTGRYLLYTPVQSRPDEKRFDTAWRKFAEICRSLHRDGLVYDVQLNLTALDPYVLISARGTAKPRKHAAIHRFTPPPPIPAQRCRDRAQEAEWFLPENRERRNNNTTHWRSRQTRYQELSQMAEEFLRAEADYWRELELLSGQRQHFKPGRTKESFRADDEVVAA